MRFKRYMFLTLILFLTIFSISFVGASENVTYDQNTGELNTLSMSDIDPIEGTLNTINVDSVDEADDDSLGNASENEMNEIDGCLTNNNETQLSNNSNNLKIDSKMITSAVNGRAVLGASNDEITNNDDLELLGATNDEPVLGADDTPWGNTMRDVMDAIVRCSNSGGGTVYLNNRTYNNNNWQTGEITAALGEIITIQNVRVVGGTRDNPYQMSTFALTNPDSTALSFHGTTTTDPRDGNSGYISSSGVNLLNVRFEYLNCTGRMFNFGSGSLTNCVFDHIESYQHAFFFYGCYVDEKPMPVINCTFTNSKQTYPGDAPQAGSDGGGQFGVVMGAELHDCKFINTSSATHGGAFCLSDEWNGAACVASKLYNCDFINITSRWFAVYIHGNYTRTSQYGETLVYPDGSNMTVNCTIEVVPIVDVSVVKTVDEDVYFVGEVVVWTIKVSNAANGTVATNVTLRDVLPAEFALINSTASVGGYANGVWYIGTMLNGTEETLVINSRAINAAEDVMNIANVTCNETEWDYSNNVDNATVTIVLLPPPVKVVNNTKPFYHEDVLYNLTIVNSGDYDYTKNVTVIDSLPEGIDYLETVGFDGAVVVSDAVLSNNNKTITWVVTNIKAHSTAVIMVKARANAVGNLTNNETLVYPGGTNMTVNCTIEVQPIVDVSVVKTVDKDVYFVGDIVIWTIKVSNAFNGTNATEVTLTDVLPAEFILAGYDATNGTYEDGVWTIGFMGNGTEETLTIISLAIKATENVTNEATVSCNETEWDYDNNYDNATVTVFMTPPPVKLVNNTKPSYHEEVTYYLTVTNVAYVAFEQELLVIDSLPDGVDYIRTVSITGADVLMNATVIDKKVHWVITNIPANSTAVIEVLAQANAVGVFTNNETLVYHDGSNMTVNATIEVEPLVDVSVVKTADKDIYFIGDIVAWTIKVSNAANGSAATNVKMYDVLPAGFILIDSTATKGSYANDVWTIGDMLNGTEETLTIYSRATVNGTFTNYANVTCNETEWNYTNNYDNDTVVVNDNPDINKTVNNTTPYTQEFVEYYLTITNVGDIDYTNELVVVDSLPKGLLYANEFKVDGAKLINVVAEGQIIKWTITNIPVNSSAVITVKVFVEATGTLVNNGTVVPPYGNNKTANCTITPIPRADLEIVKLVSKPKSNVNDIVTWTLIVKNNGPDTAVNAVVSDKLPYGVAYLSDDSKGAYNHKTGIWKLGNLAKGETRTLKIKTKVTTTNITITNFANVSSDTPDPNETNNRANNTTVVPPVADLILIKDVDKDRVRVGDKVVFSIVVINLGPDTAVNTRAYDVLPDGMKLISFKTSRGTYDPVTGVWTIGDLANQSTVILTIVAEALKEGVVVNEAYVESDTYDPDESNNYDNATVIVEEPDEPPEPPVPTLHPTGNPIVMVLLSLLAMVGVTLRRRN